MASRGWKGLIVAVDFLNCT